MANTSRRRDDAGMRSIPDHIVACGTIPTFWFAAERAWESALGSST